VSCDVSILPPTLGCTLPPQDDIGHQSAVVGQSETACNDGLYLYSKTAIKSKLISGDNYK